MGEMTAMQQSIFDLDRIHAKMKQSYDDEIRRLRQELEERGVSVRKPSAIQDGPPPNLSTANRSYQMGGQAPNFAGMDIDIILENFSNIIDKDPRRQYDQPQQGPKTTGPPNMRHRDSMTGISLNPVKGQPGRQEPQHHEYRHSVIFFNCSHTIKDLPRQDLVPQCNLEQ